MNSFHSYFAAFQKLNLSSPEADLIGISPMVEVEMLLDTGATICCIPESAITKIEEKIGQALPFVNTPVRGFDQIITIQRVYKLQLNNTDFNHEGTHDFLAIPGETGIIGRDLLNHNIILLDGPMREWWCYGRGRFLSFVRFMMKYIHTKPSNFDKVEVG